jgi:hypothetical protein
MLTALMSGKALTASELAAEAGVTLQTASAHLAKLDQGGLLQQRKQGRHKYFTLAGSEVAAVLEALMGFAAGAGHLRSRTGPRDPELRKARVCYNHLAGDLGIRLYDSLVARGFLTLGESGLDLSEQGRRFMQRFGLDLEGLAARRSPLCRECLDWSERRSHLAGGLGRALLGRIEDLGWARRVDGTRIVRFSPKGEAAFRRKFPLP